MNLSEAKQAIKDAGLENADEVIQVFDDEIKKERENKQKAINEKKDYQSRLDELQKVADSLAQYADEGEDQSEQLKNLQEKLKNLEKRASEAENSKSKLEQEKEQIEQELSQLKQEQKISQAAEKLGANKVALARFVEGKRLELDDEGNVKVAPSTDAEDKELQEFTEFVNNSEEGQALYPSLFPQQQQQQGQPLPTGSPNSSNGQSFSRQLREIGLGDFRTN